MLVRTALDRAVLPEYQRRNIMNAMEVRLPKESIDQFDALLSTENNWQTVRGVTSAHRRRSIDVVARLLDSVPEVETPRGVTLRPVEAFDERIDALWAEASRPYRMIIARTKGYLNYRYADPRAGVYTIVIAEEGERILGYIVTTALRGTGHIADMLVLPDHLDVLEPLVADALRRLRDARNTSAECWRFAYHPYVPTLEKLGFDQPRRTHRFSLQSLSCRDEEIAFFADPKTAAHVTAGDTDLV
jgi:hypothetical protein